MARAGQRLEHCGCRRLLWAAAHCSRPRPRRPPAASTTAGGKGTAQDKIAALQAAGVTVTNSPAQMGATMKRVMQERGLL